MHNSLAKAWRLLRREIAKIPIGNSRFCTACNSRIGRFLPYRKGWKGMPPLMIGLDVIGSDVDHFSCPKCGAHDRERHLILYFERLDLWRNLKGARVLHFAPELRLSEKISNCHPDIYIRADLIPAATKIMKMDIHDIPFEDGCFDFVICNHVLEHVDDDQKALAEIHRVIKSGGMAILQTPYSAKLKVTFSDPGIDTDDLRLQLYGQEDHVRLYGADIASRFESCGLSSRMQEHNALLPDIQAERFGVNAKEPLFLFSKI
jgi:SAM-dependent methyltransferase